MRPLSIRLSFAGLGVLAFTGAASAQTGDRYGSGPVLYATPGSRFAPVAAPTTTPAIVAPSTRSRVLSWPGKTAAHAPEVATRAPAPPPATPPLQPPHATRGDAASEQGWVPVAVAAPGAPHLGPPVQPWTQRYAAARRTPLTPPPATGSIYAAAAPNPSTGAPVGGARYYSLHRAYGMTPDAAPIPPQFFGPTADLGAPETSEAVRRANATVATVNSARLASEAAQ